MNTDCIVVGWLTEILVCIAEQRVLIIGSRFVANEAETQLRIHKDVQPGKPAPGDWKEHEKWQVDYAFHVWDTVVDRNEF